MTERRQATFEGVEFRAVDVAELPPGIVGRVECRMVPWDEPGRIGLGIREAIPASAITNLDAIPGAPVSFPHGTPAGVVSAVQNRADGLYGVLDLADTTAGRDGMTLVRTRAVRSVSIEFNYDPAKDTWNQSRSLVTRGAVEVTGVALTHQPAYPGAQITAHRNEERTMSETLAPEATPEAPAAPALDLSTYATRSEVDALRTRIAASTHVTAEAQHPLSQFRSFGEYVKAVYQGGVEERALNVSALSEQTGLIPPTWLKDVKGVLDRGRPCINALGGPLSAGTVGLDIKWPIFSGDLSAIVATVAADGTEANSADIDITVGSATLALYASANRLTYQVIERADPSYVEAWMRIMVGAYGTETDYAFQTALWANDTIATGVDYDFSADTTGSAFVEAVWAAACDVETATGQPAEVVYASSAVFRKLAGWSAFNAQNYPVQNTGGVFDGTTLRASVLGLPIVMARNFATDETQDAIVTNRAAVGWAEDGPRFASAEQAGNVSRDIAIYGFAVATPFIPAGIVSVYNAA